MVSIPPSSRDISPFDPSSRHPGHKAPQAELPVLLAAEDHEGLAAARQAIQDLGWWRPKLLEIAAEVGWKSLKVLGLL